MIKELSDEIQQMNILNAETTGEQCRDTGWPIIFFLNKCEGKLWCEPEELTEEWYSHEDTYNDTVEFCNRFGVKEGVYTGEEANRILRRYKMLNAVCYFNEDEGE